MVPSNKEMFRDFGWGVIFPVANITKVVSRNFAELAPNQVPFLLRRTDRRRNGHGKSKLKDRLFCVWQLNTTKPFYLNFG